MNPMVNELISRNRGAVRELCVAQRVAGLELFGSAVSDDFDPERSDLDFLVQFEDPDRPGIADRFMGLAEGLERIFRRRVDLVTRKSLKNPFFANAVNRSKQLVYAG
jgi:predicted nucleotidyltransferase